MNDSYFVTVVKGLFVFLIGFTVGVSVPVSLAQTREFPPAVHPSVPQDFPTRSFRIIDLKEGGYLACFEDGESNAAACYPLQDVPPFLCLIGKVNEGAPVIECREMSDVI